MQWKFHHKHFSLLKRKLLETLQKLTLWCLRIYIWGILCLIMYLGSFATYPRYFTVHASIFLGTFWKICLQKCNKKGLNGGFDKWLTWCFWGSIGGPKPGQPTSNRPLLLMYEFIITYKIMDWNSFAQKRKWPLIN